LGNILDFTYDYNLGTADNGEVKQIANNRNTARTQNFTYDSLNRILTASTQATTGTYAWGLQFGYDIWGNLLTSSLTQGSAPILTVSADSSNRISGFCYDAAGNLLGQTAPPCPSPTYTYDAENRIKTTAGVTYTYDGDGNRVQKSNGKLYWYGSGSLILDESDATGNITNEYIFFGGKRLARRVVSSGQIQYYFADHLGSSRVVTDASGNILDDADFYPFGGERTYTSTSGNAFKFTGKERDTESGLDDFGARYYTSQFGRFMTPDWSASPVLVPYADLGNPQTFNLYSYVANNPLNTVDPEGHFRLDPPGSFRSKYNDPDTGNPLYGEPSSDEEKAYVAEVAAAQAQLESTQQKNQGKNKTKPQDTQYVIVPDLQSDSGPGGVRERRAYYNVYPADKRGDISATHPDHDHTIELREKLLSGAVEICGKAGSCVEKGTLVDDMRVFGGSPHSVEKRFFVKEGDSLKPMKVYDPATKKAFDYIRVDASAERGFILTYHNNSQ